MGSSKKKSAAPLVIIALAIGAIIVWVLINRHDRVQLCAIGPCPQPSATASHRVLR